ncbi:hypothetical protein GX411_11320 [Candidatus Fermentibacteria bacterium]|nr:hypothetical protein [Candidatus Fermentibacteria bacterium]
MAGLLAAVLGLIAVAELSARGYLLVRGIPAGRYISATAAVREARAAASAGFDTEYPYLPFRPAPGRTAAPSVDSLGFVGPETGWEPPPGAFRVIFAGGSMVYDGLFPSAADSCLDALLSGGACGFDSCQALISSAPTWTTAENLVYYAIRGVYARPHAIVLYVAVNDVYAMSHPDSVTTEPDYSHYRSRWMPVAPAPWDRIPGWADSSRAVALARYALDRLFYPGVLGSPPRRLGLRYEYDPGQVVGTGFGSYVAGLEAIAAIAESRGTRVFLVSELQEPSLSSGPAMVAAVDDLNAAAAEVAARHSAKGLVSFVDAASLITADSTTMADKSHLTPEGGRRLGALVAGEIFRSLQTAASTGGSAGTAP